MQYDAWKEEHDAWVENDKNTPKVLIGLGLFILILIFVPTLLFGKTKNNCASCNGGIKMSTNVNDFKGMNYNDVKNELQDLGFTNIRTVPKYDLITGWLHKQGSVESVSIDGDKEFEEGDAFYKDAPIRIVYHEFESEREKAKMNRINNFF